MQMPNRDQYELDRLPGTGVSEPIDFEAEYKRMFSGEDREFRKQERLRAIELAKAKASETRQKFVAKSNSGVRRVIQVGKRNR